MTFSYYPGCTLKTKAVALDEYARRSMEALGITLEEIPEWQCCGGVYVTAKDEIASKLASVRALMAARDAGRDLVTLCSACHNVLKQVNSDMANDAEMQMKVNNYMAPEVPYTGETNVLHFLEVLRDHIGWDELARRVTNPLTGKKIGGYYGCLLLRPGKVMQMDDPENPKILEDFIRAIGATPVVYAERNECCGGYVTMSDPAFAEKRGNSVIENAKDQGAELLVTACPLCLYNLTHNRSEDSLPVCYFTELLAEALGVK